MRYPDGSTHERRTCYPCELAQKREREAKPAITAPMPEVVATAPAPAPLPPLEMAFAETAKERERRDLKSEHRALVAEVERQRALLEALRPLHGESHARIPPAPPPEKGEAVPLLLISDLHLEEEVDLEKMHSLNEFNLAIAEQRMHAYFRNSLRLINMVARDSLGAIV